MGVELRSWVVLVAAALSTWACGAQQAQEIDAVSAGDGAIVVDARTAKGASILVYGREGDVLAEGVPWARARGSLQLAGLPEDWSWIAFRRGRFFGFGEPVPWGRLDRSSVASGSSDGVHEGNAYLKWIVVGLFLLGAFWGVVSIEATQGGQHAFIVSLLILLGYIGASPAWPAHLRTTFVAIAGVALVAGIPVSALVQGGRRRVVVGFQIGYAVLYTVILGIIVAPKSPAATNRWMTQGAVSVRSSEAVGEWRVVEGDGTVLDVGPVVSGSLLVFVPAGRSNTRVEVILADRDGSAVSILTDSQPEG